MMTPYDWLIVIFTQLFNHTQSVKPLENGNALPFHFHFNTIS